MKILYFLVDCETGKTLFTMDSYWRGGIDPVQKYIDSLKKIKKLFETSPDPPTIFHGMRCTTASL